MQEARYIAVVDDEEAVCRALKRLLQSYGFEVEAFASGAEFLGSLGHRVPSSVVLDHRMPGMTGLEVLSRLRQLDSACAVVFLTGDDNAELRQRAITQGASAYLHKPVDEEELLDAVRNSFADG